MYHAKLRGASPAHADYELHVAHDMDALAPWRAGWERLWRADPEADLYLSWPWLGRVLAAHPGRWRVYLLTEPGGGPVRCILPLHADMSQARKNDPAEAILRPAGRLAIAEYTGLLCDPDHLGPAIEAMARSLAAQPWRAFTMNYMPALERAERLMAAFSALGFRCKRLENRDNGGATDLLICPQAALADDFEAYLMGLSRSRRQKIRRAIRSHVETGEIRLTLSDLTDPERDYERLLDLWQSRWRAEKSESRLERALRMQRRMFRICHAAGVLHIPILWHRDRPVAGIALIENARRGALVVKLIGRDPTLADLPVGLLLHALTIDWAIGRGTRIYDFGHGDEAYKFSFGSHPVPLMRFVVKRPRRS